MATDTRSHKFERLYHSSVPHLTHIHTKDWTSVQTYLGSSEAALHCATSRRLIKFDLKNDQRQFTSFKSLWSLIFRFSVAWSRTWRNVPSSPPGVWCVTLSIALQPCFFRSSLSQLLPFCTFFCCSKLISPVNHCNPHFHAVHIFVWQSVPENISMVPFQLQ